MWEYVFNVEPKLPDTMFFTSFGVQLIQDGRKKVVT